MLAAFEERVLVLWHGEGDQSPRCVPKSVELLPNVGSGCCITFGIGNGLWMARKTIKSIQLQPREPESDGWVVVTVLCGGRQTWHHCCWVTSMPALVLLHGKGHVHEEALDLQHCRTLLAELWTLLYHDDLLEVMLLVCAG